jgi:carboxyl-terminal processing protease
MFKFNFNFSFDQKKIVYSVALIICFFVAFGLGIWVGVEKVAYCVPQPENINFSLFWDAYNKLQEKFINPNDIDDQKIIYGAIEGMAKSLGDPYTSYFPPEEAKRFTQDLSGSFEGIGAVLGIKENRLTIISPLEGTPAKEAGLKAGDIIVKINGQESTDMSTEEAVNLIRGPKGTNVTLSIYRDGWTNSKDFTMTRNTIEIPSTSWDLKDNNTAYIQIFQFDDSLSRNFKNQVYQILKSPAERIVLDLRNNPGGYLGTAQEIAGYFLENGQTVLIEDFGGKKEQQTYKAPGNGELLKYPVVVLINEGSASASEILAGALRDNRNIRLIGEKSFGKGSVQEIAELRGGSFLKITIAKWLTPKGNLIADVGLEPDIKIEITDKEAEEGKDPQLDKALEIIKDLK